MDRRKQKKKQTARPRICFLNLLIKSRLAPAHDQPENLLRLLRCGDLLKIIFHHLTADLFRQLNRQLTNLPFPFTQKKSCGLRKISASFSSILWFKSRPSDDPDTAYRHTIHQQRHRNSGQGGVQPPRLIIPVIDLLLLSHHF